jgi:hypothetical protein
MRTLGLAGVGFHARGSSPPADCASHAQADGPGVGYFWCSSAAGRRNMFFDDGWQAMKRSHCVATTQAISITVYPVAIHGQPPRRRAHESTSPRRFGHVSLAPFLAGASPHGSEPTPQRLPARIDWTPARRSQDYLANHVSVPPQPAITPGSSFTSSGHLQTAARNTYQPPDFHIMDHVASCYTLNSSGTFLSGDGHFGPAADLHRHLGLNNHPSLTTPLRFNDAR